MEEENEVQTDKRVTHVFNVGKNVRAIRLEFDEDGVFTELAIDYGERRDN